MNMLDATAVAKLLRQQHGRSAETFVQRRIRFFEAEPSKASAVAAWRQVAEALATIGLDGRLYHTTPGIRRPVFAPSLRRQGTGD